MGGVARRKKLVGIDRVGIDRVDGLRAQQVICPKLRVADLQIPLSTPQPDQRPTRSLWPGHRMDYACTGRLALDDAQYPCTRHALFLCARAAKRHKLEPPPQRRLLVRPLFLP